MTILSYCVDINLKSLHGITTLLAVFWLDFYAVGLAAFPALSAASYLSVLAYDTSFALFRVLTALFRNYSEGQLIIPY